MTPTDRRGFVSRLAAVGATLGLSLPRAAHAAEQGGQVQDDPWMARLGGRHRVVFHSHLPTEALVLRWAATYLDTQRDSYGLPENEHGVVVGLNGRAIGWCFGDALWARYPTIGEVMGAPGATNPQSRALAALRDRGVIVLVCGNSIRASGSRFLPPELRNRADTTAAFAEEVRATLVPGAEIVPSMVVTLQQAQDRGCRYIYAGG
jgi:intracellular sulfur oxidation DsrE/DsrF family protein